MDDVSMGQRRTEETHPRQTEEPIAIPFEPLLAAHCEDDLLQTKLPCAASPLYTHLMQLTLQLEQSEKAALPVP